MIPRMWTDPLAGSTYATRAQLPSAHMNDYLGSLRAHEICFERGMLYSWTGGGVAPDATVSNLSFNPGNGCFIAIKGDTTTPVAWYSVDLQVWTALTVDAQNGLSPVWEYSVANYGGYCVWCGAPGASSTKKYRAIVPGDFRLMAGTSTYNDTSGMNAICYDPQNSLWVAGGDSGHIETATNANVVSTWTRQTNAANSNMIRAIASNQLTGGNGRIIATAAIQTNKAITSTDAVTWSEVTLPASAFWSGICYSPILSKWFAAGSVPGSGLVLASSSNGTSWASVSMTVIPAPKSGTTELALDLQTTGNGLLLAYGPAAPNVRRVASSFDSGVNWNLVKERDSSSAALNLCVVRRSEVTWASRVAYCDSSGVPQSTIEMF